MTNLLFPKFFPNNEQRFQIRHKFPPEKETTRSVLTIVWLKEDFFPINILVNMTNTNTV